MTAELVREWIEKAEQDYLSALCLARRKARPLPDSVCFHAQQCAEKYLKAFLVSRGMRFSKIHDLIELLRLCQSEAAGFSKILEPLDNLNAFSVETRYPGASASIEDARAAVSDMKRVRAFVRKQGFR